MRGIRPLPNAQTTPKGDTVALHIFRTAIERVLRQHGPGARAASRLGAVVFIHRFGALRGSKIKRQDSLVGSDSRLWPPERQTSAAQAATGTDNGHAEAGQSVAVWKIWQEINDLYMDGNGRNT